MRSSTASVGASYDEGRRRFVEDFGQLFARYGLGPSFGRVFGLLLMSDEPLSLDEIAESLGISKSGTSVAARELERAGVARRLSTPGSRRALYEASDEFESIFHSQFGRVREQLGSLERADGLLPRGRAKTRMRRLKELHEFWLSESEAIIDRWRRRSERAASTIG